VSFANSTSVPENYKIEKGELTMMSWVGKGFTIAVGHQSGHGFFENRYCVSGT
jgi:hypothetical protein